MPLIRSDEPAKLEIDKQTIAFFMRDVTDNRRVTCHASRDALQDRLAPSHDTALHNLLEHSKMLQSSIEQVASDLYDAGQAEPLVDH